jgi:hypothetical protein
MQETSSVQAAIRAPALATLSDDHLLEIWKELKPNPRDDLGNDVAQQVALELLTRRAKDDLPDNPPAWAKKRARCLRQEYYKPDQITTPEGTKQRIRREVDVSDQVVEQAMSRSWWGADPAQLLDLKQEVLSRGQEARAKLFGGPRMAECHLARPHYSGGLCKPCYNSRHRTSKTG